MGYKIEIFKVHTNMNLNEIENLNKALKKAVKIELLKNCDNKGNKYIEVFVFYKKENNNVQK